MPLPPNLPGLDVTGTELLSANQVQTDGTFKRFRLSLAAIAMWLSINGKAGPAGPKGDPGTNGTNGKDGLAGTPGTAGAAGKDGAAGSNGKDGAAGTNGTNGTNGAAGKDGIVPAYDAAGLIAGLKLSILTVPTNASGVWTADLTKAGFATVLNVQPMAVSGSAALASQAQANLTSFSNTSATGVVTLPNTIALGGAPNKLAGAGLSVQVLVFGK